MIDIKKHIADYKDGKSLCVTLAGYLLICSCFSKEDWEKNRFQILKQVIAENIYG